MVYTKRLERARAFFSKKKKTFGGAATVLWKFPEGDGTFQTQYNTGTLEITLEKMEKIVGFSRGREKKKTFGWRQQQQAGKRGTFYECSGILIWKKKNVWGGASVLGLENEVISKEMVRGDPQFTVVKPRVYICIQMKPRSDSQQMSIESIELKSWRFSFGSDEWSE